jgi:hypothetical protein
MQGDDFNEFLIRFVEQVETCGRSGCPVDAIQFKMDMSKMYMGWRDEHIIPRYNAASYSERLRHDVTLTRLWPFFEYCSG